MEMVHVSQKSLSDEDDDSLLELINVIVGANNEEVQKGEEEGVHQSSDDKISQPEVDIVLHDFINTDEFEENDNDSEEPAPPILEISTSVFEEEDDNDQDPLSSILNIDMDYSGTDDGGELAMPELKPEAESDKKIKTEEKENDEMELTSSPTEITQTKESKPVLEVSAFKCPYCMEIFIEAELMISHLRKHGHSGCDQPQPTQEKFNHITYKYIKSSESAQENEEDPRLTCSECGHTFYKRWNLIRHMRLHTNRHGKWKCSLCNLHFQRSSSLTFHKMKVHEKGSEQKRPAPTKNSGSAFNPKTALRHFGLSHPCRVLLKRCDSLGLARLSMSMKYRRDKNGFWKCPRCPRSFSHKYKVGRHLVVHTKLKPFKCSLCPKSFGFRENLIVHSRIHTGEKPYSCQWCPKTFRSTANLDNHRRTHTGEKPYKCPICPRRFTCYSNRKNHMVVHTNEKPHKCSICFKAFSLTQHLNRHLLIHKDVFPYKCGYCPKWFRTTSNLMAHKKRMHYSAISRQRKMT